jgi:hypothetical protein
MKKSSGRAKATRKTRSLPAKALSAKKAASVKGGRKAGGDPQSSGKPFLQYRFGTVFTTK